MCSRQAIKKYVQANNNLSGVSDNFFTAQFNKALQKGSESGVFTRPKGMCSESDVENASRSKHRTRASQHESPPGQQSLMPF